MNSKKIEQKKSKDDEAQPKAFKKHKRRTLKRIILALVGFVVIVFILDTAMLYIGVKTNFLHRWGSHQYFGEIVEMKDGNFVIQGRGSERKTIFVTEETDYKKGTKAFRDVLHVGDKVMVLGPENDSGQIEAKLIRIFDLSDPTQTKELLPPNF